MNKKFIAFGTLLAAGGLAVLALYLYFLRPVESRAPTAKELDARAARLGIVLPPSAPAAVHPAAPIDPKKPVRLAIGWLGLPDQAQNEQVADLMLTELSPVKNLQLVDRQSLDKVLQEAQMGLSGVVRRGTATRLGKLLRADWFLLGCAATVNGSNYLVVRLVDARTGVMLNADLFSRQEGISSLVSKMSTFVERSRESASHPSKSRVYLALGGFQDVSANDRQAGFPDKLRGYLTAAYQGNPNVTLLEREFVDLLQQELRLDLAGLTEESATNTSQPMQAAFWLVDGYYESYETAGYEVEVVLRVHRMFGQTARDTVRGPAEEVLYHQIKEKIEGVMAQGNQPLRMPTRATEIQAQLDQGQALAGLYVFGPGAVMVSEYFRNKDDENRARHNLEEAIRAYRTVLILDPENHKAKMGLALCLQHPLIGKTAEARDLILEVAESKVEDNLNLPAMVGLGRFYRYSDPAQAVEWFKRASEYSKTHPSPPEPGPVVRQINEPERYLQLAESVTAEMRARRNPAAAGQSEAESLLIEGTRRMETLFKSQGNSMITSSGFGIGSFVRSFGTNQAAAVNRLDELLPGLLEKFPELAPHLLAIALTYQLDTNSPMVAKFLQSFEHCAEHPDGVLDNHLYFSQLSRDCYNWCLEHKMYALALRLVEVKHRVQMKDEGVEPRFGLTVGLWTNGPVLLDTNTIMLEDNVRMIYARMGLEDWRDALDLLEKIPNQPFFVGGGGPWGGEIIPAELIARCREKLGLPVEKDPRIFSLGKPWRTFQQPVILTADESSLWVSDGYKLWKMALDTETKTEIAIRKAPNSRIAVLCSGASNLWIGTVGNGLIEYDRQSHECRRFTEKDGLLVNDICALCPQGEVLWLGFGIVGGSYRDMGGLGRLDLRTGKATAITPSLHPDSRNSNLAPRNSVVGIATGRANELLVSIGWSNLLRYRTEDNSWETLSWMARCLASDSRHLVIGLDNVTRTRLTHKGVGAIIQNFAGGQFDDIGEMAGLPFSQVTAVALEGNDVWMSGAEFVGVMDNRDKVLRKLCYTHSPGANHIEVAGGYAWVLMNQDLYRIPLSETR